MPVPAPESSGCGKKLSYLWIIDLSFAARLHHGGLLRYLNLSRELVAQGHTVTFAVYYQDDRERSIEWLNSLRDEGVFTNHCAVVVDRSVPRWRRCATLLLPFRLHYYAIRPFIHQVTAAIQSLLREHPADVVIVSSRVFLFVAHRIGLPVCIGDFSDSATLATWRELAQNLRRGKLAAASRHARDLLHCFFHEMYSSRNYTANIIVSPVDKRIFDLVGARRKNVCIANGVRTGVDLARVVKIPGQLIFSGAMDFPPNRDGALWFLDRVFPLVLRRFPQVTFVIAGANPPPALLSRANSNVLVPGYLPDLNLAIAQSALYVAPLVSGSGFKNKVAESIANGTYLIGTTYAVEFLEPDLRALITVRDDPAGMAAAIGEFLSDPVAFDGKLSRLTQIVTGRFSWPARAAELVALSQALIRGSAATADPDVLKS